MSRTVWKPSHTHPRSRDLMRREDSSVITLNPDEGCAFQVIRSQAPRVMLMEDRVCLQLSWGSLLSCIAYIGALGHLENSSIIWAVVQVTACHCSFGSWESLMSLLVFRVVVIMLTSNNQWQMTFNLKCTCFFPQCTLVYESSHGTINDKDNGPIMNSGESKTLCILWFGLFVV